MVVTKIKCKKCDTVTVIENSSMLSIFQIAYTPCSKCGSLETDFGETPTIINIVGGGRTDGYLNRYKQSNTSGQGRRDSSPDQDYSQA